MTTPAARPPHAGPTYLLGRAVTPGAAETRRFLTRNRVPFQWVDLDEDPLAKLLGGDEAFRGRRLPCVLFADGSILEGPERFMRTRFVGASAAGGESDVPAEEQQAYVETARFATELAERVGGQAGTSARIENYPGFPHGISGAELAERGRDGDRARPPLLADDASGR